MADVRYLTLKPISVDNVLIILCIPSRTDASGVAGMVFVVLPRTGLSSEELRTVPRERPAHYLKPADGTAELHLGLKSPLNHRKLSSDGQWLNKDQQLTMWQSMHHFGKVTKANTPKAGFMDPKP